MKNKFVQRALALLLALVCVLGALPLSAFAAGLSSAPGSITQRSSDYMKIGGRSVRYKAASSDINNVGLPYVFDEQVTVPGLDAPIRALCAYQRGTLGPAANGQKWNFKEEVSSASLKVLLTYIYSHTYGDFTDTGSAIGLDHWNQYWSDIWFLVAQAMSWYYEHGIIKDVNSDREGFIEQASEEFVAAMRLYHETYGQSSWITDWSKIGTHSIIDSKDGGATGYSAYDYVSTGVNLVMDHPEYYHSYHLWIYDWDKSQPWKLAGQSGVPMQRLLIAVPDPEEPAIDTVQLTVRKLEAGTNKPMSGVSFKIENANDPAAFSVIRATGADGTITLTKEADDLTAGQYLITEEAVPEGYVAQTASQLVTVLPNGSANSVFTFYNEPESPDTPTPDTPSTGTGTIKKVDADNPTVGIPGAVIRITSVKLDDGGSFFGEYVTKDGGYILKEDLDFSKRFGLHAPEFGCCHVHDMAKYISAMARELEQGVRPPFLDEKAAAVEYILFRDTVLPSLPGPAKGGGAQLQLPGPGRWPKENRPYGRQPGGYTPQASRPRKPYRSTDFMYPARMTPRKPLRSHASARKNLTKRRRPSVER